jgi:hypothetical protein
VVDAADGSECEDGLFCTAKDTCQGGLCKAGPPNDCGDKPPACSVVTCNETSKTCSTAPANNNTPCSPSDPCQLNAKCTNGLCIGTPNDCFFTPVPNECHVGVCNKQNGKCEPQPGNDGGSCTDTADLCTVGKTCSNGVCGGGTPKDCSALTKGCFNGACNAQTGQCFQDPVQPGQKCAEATNACNQGLCSANGTCEPSPINEGLACDDGLGCTTGTVCQAGKCAGGITTIENYLFEEFADNAAGWQLDTEWQIGPAKTSSGQVYGNPDPATDHTSANTNNGVAGVVIGGNASTANVHGYYWLTSPAVEVSTKQTVYFEFWRWLNSDYLPFMQNAVQVYDGTTWVTLWESGNSPGVQDSTWQKVTFDLTKYKNSQLRVRFGFQIGSSGVYTVSQWNVDDVLISNGPCT